MRVIFTKSGCEMCMEFLITVDIFNKLHPDNPIIIIDSDSYHFDKYANVAIHAFGDEFMTPAMIFDNFRISGASDWKEMQSYLSTLNKMSKEVS